MVIYSNWLKVEKYFTFAILQVTEISALIIFVLYFQMSLMSNV